MTSVIRLCVFYVVVPLLPTLTWKPGPHAVPADYRRQPADWRSRSRSRPVGWGRGGVQGRRRYGGNNYDVNEEEQGPSVATLRMPGVYVQQVRHRPTIIIVIIVIIIIIVVVVVTIRLHIFYFNHLHVVHDHIIVR